MHIASVLFSATLFYFTLQSSPIVHIYSLLLFFHEKAANLTKKGASPNKITVKTESIPHKSYKNAEKITFSAFFIYILTSFSSLM